jgi:hypothetical protein
MDSAQFREAARTAIDESKFVKIESVTLGVIMLTTDIQSLITTTMSRRNVWYRTSSQATFDLCSHPQPLSKESPGPTSMLISSPKFFLESPIGQAPDLWPSFHAQAVILLH